MNTEYSLAYWSENFTRDVEEFAQFWLDMTNQQPFEFPERMSLGDWDEQFIM